MTDDDERTFIAFVRSERNVSIFMDVQESEKIAELDQLPTRDIPGWFGLCLWDRDHSPPPVMRYVKEQGHFVVNRTESEVIEFHRCIVDEGRLVRGRIWAEMHFWRYDDPPTLIKKSEAFCKWYNRLANWIKRRSTRNAVGDYLLPGAAQIAKQGGVLCQAVFADGSGIPEAPTDQQVLSHILPSSQPATSPARRRR